MGRTKKYIVIAAMAMLIAACKKPYYPPAITAPNSYLVVDGNIAIGDSSVVRLSYTVNISGAAKSKPETNATITVEGSQSGSYTFTSHGDGSYVLNQPNLPSNQNYRLKITTGDGRQYASDFVPVKNSPVIDSVGFGIKTTGATNGVQISLNTHDVTNSTRYYRWQYIETYLIQSAYNSHWIVVNHDTTAPRTAAQQIYHCWPSDTSGNLVLGSSANLAKDVIVQQPLVVVPSNSEKLRFRYSILVKQYALTTAAYNYYILLQKNTEQLGSIFDAQPSTLTGNIHGITDPNEPVIGYVTAGGVQQARIFIDKSQLPAWTPQTPYGTCEADSILYIVILPGGPPAYIEHPVHDLIYSGGFTPIDTIGNVGFTAAFPTCVDCTLRGTNIQPSFWK